MASSDSIISVLWAGYPILIRKLVAAEKLTGEDAVEIAEAIFEMVGPHKPSLALAEKMVNDFRQEYLVPSPPPKRMPRKKPSAT